MIAANATVGRQGRVDLNSHGLYYELHGPEDGPIVVLLHTGLGSVEDWSAQVTPLTAAGCRVLVYDRWGYGRSDERPGFCPPDFRDDLTDLGTLLDQLGLGRVALVGHSDGGTIALQFAARYPQRVALLVTVAAHIYAEPGTERHIIALRRAYEQKETLRAAFAHRHGEKSEALTKAWFAGWFHPRNRNWHIGKELSNIRCPALVVQGTQDESATPQHARDIATAIQGAELQLVPGVAHMLPQEIPGEFNQRLLTFLKKHLKEMNLGNHHVQQSLDC